LALRLEGPLQSWGFDSQYNRRGTGLLPTRSAVAGMCCAALGYPRGSAAEAAFLNDFVAVRMTTIAIPRKCAKDELPVRRLLDFHTVQNTAIAKRIKSGKVETKDCHITHRQYLTDAAFGVILEGPAELLDQTAKALGDPIWGLWLGRKTCIPTAPILAGLETSLAAALKLLIGEQPLSAFTHQREADDFGSGRDSLPDAPLSFASERRLFATRRVRTEPRRS